MLILQTFKKHSFTSNNIFYKAVSMRVKSTGNYPDWFNIYHHQENKKDVESIELKTVENFKIMQ